MSSSQEALDVVKAILPDVTHRKMMGEYLLYRDGVLFGGIYDDRLLLKITKSSAAILRDCPAAFPYEGGGEMILFPEPYDAPLLQKVVASMTEELRKPRGRSRNSVLHRAGRSLRSLRESNRSVLPQGFPGHPVGKRRITGRLACLLNSTAV